MTRCFNDSCNFMSQIYQVTFVDTIVRTFSFDVVKCILPCFFNGFCVNLFHFQAAMIGTADAPTQNVLPFQNVFHNQVSQNLFK